MEKLAEMTVTERTTLTRNLTIIEKKGLIVIEPGKDRRERSLSISERGQELLLESLPCGMPLMALSSGASEVTVCIAC